MKSLNKKNKIKIFLIASVVILLLGVIFILTNFLFLEFSYKNKFLPNTKIAGISLSGKTKTEAEEILVTKIQAWDEIPIVFKADEENWKVDKKDLSISFKIEDTLNMAYNYSREDNIFIQVFKKIPVFFFQRNTLLLYEANNLDGIVVDISKKANIEGSNLGLIIKAGEITESEEVTGRSIKTHETQKLLSDLIENLLIDEIELPFIRIYPASDLTKISNLKEEIDDFLDKDLTLNYQNKKWFLEKSKIGEWLSVENKKSSPAKIDENQYEINHYFNKMMTSFGLAYFIEGELSLSLNEVKVSEYLEEISKSINVLSKNAKLGIQEEKVVLLEPDKTGLELDKETAFNELIYSLRNDYSSVNLPVKITKAEVREDNLTELGILELISQGISDFSGSSAARIINVRVGSEKFNGHLIKPGEEFSFVEVLGPVTGAAGFLPEIVIKPGRLVKEYGGGLCQVATTAFRVALYAGLPITERKNHSFVVSMYFWPFSGPGTDATIYGPHPDLRFVNDTGKYILIQTYIEGKRLYFDFYGTKGSRSAKLEGPFTTSYGSDGSRTTVLYRNVYDGSQLKRRDTFKSFYKPASDFQRVN